MLSKGLARPPTRSLPRPAQVTGDRVKERRATRGLAASARMQGQLRQVRGTRSFCPSALCSIASSSSSPHPNLLALAC